LYAKIDFKIGLQFEGATNYSQFSNKRIFGQNFENLGKKFDNWLLASRLKFIGGGSAHVCLMLVVASMSVSCWRNRFK
jgi:hypothetical protein